MRELVRDRESSMRALSMGEQQLLTNITERYQPSIREVGASHVIDELRTKLVRRYDLSPAQVVRDDGATTIKLPVSWNDFQVLSLSAAERERALRAYYQDVHHSALRYLSKPNYWMHRGSSYVNVNEENPDERWSTFEEYQPLIAVLWLAAQDESAEAKPTDNHTLEGRIAHFIKELMLIGRAHNWDQTRVRNGKEEEYDDLEGDRPSCYSGVKRRLFQSLIGHPLYKVITSDDIRQEVRGFAFTSFTSKLSRFNHVHAVYKAFQRYIETLEVDEKDAATLTSLNITDEEKEAFIQSLQTKYGDNLSKHPSFLAQIESMLALDLESKEISDHYHALKLDGLTGLFGYLCHNITSSASSNSSSSSSSPGSFATHVHTSPPQTEEEEAQLEDDHAAQMDITTERVSRKRNHDAI